MNEQSPLAPVLQAIDVRKRFYQGSTEVPVLNGVDLALTPGERVAIIGRSGSGKSSLLHILAGLDTADAGQVSVVGEDMGGASSEQRAALRCAHMGFVYQQHHLLPEFSAVENVALPQRLNRLDKNVAEASSREILEAVGSGAPAGNIYPRLCPAASVSAWLWPGRWPTSRSIGVGRRAHWQFRSSQRRATDGS